MKISEKYGMSKKFHWFAKFLLFLVTRLMKKEDPSKPSPGQQSAIENQGAAAIFMQKNRFFY